MMGALTCTFHGAAECTTLPTLFTHTMVPCEFRDRHSLTMFPTRSLWLLPNIKKERIDSKGLLDACERTKSGGGLNARTCPWQEAQRT